MVHLVTSKDVDGIVVFTSACSIDDSTAHHWTINRSLVTCWKCKQKV